MSSTFLQNRAKELAATAALSFVQGGMIVGLGSGSTTSYFIESLSRRCREEGLSIVAIATSQQSEKLARKGGIPLREGEEFSFVDLTVDGADEIDSVKRMIKGGGGAFVREKIVATASREVIIIVDESKLVEQLGLFPLPVEIFPFGYRATLVQLEEKGYQGLLRAKEGRPFVTDNGNYIVDIKLPLPLQEPEREHERIASCVGVVETGFFFNLATRVIVGFFDGRVESYSLFKGEYEL